MKKLLTVLIVILSVSLYAKNDTNKAETIKTFICCEGCVKGLEYNVAYIKGIKDVKVNYDKDIIEVTYNAKQTDLNKICSSIAETGFNANDVKGSDKARAKMSHCCKSALESGVKSEGHGHAH